MTRRRPTSPHMIYKPQITSVLSILHRFTGLGLSAGLLLVGYWLSSIAAGEARYVEAQANLTSPFGLLILSVWIFTFFYHFANGIRHLVWDAGWGFEMPTVHKTGWAVVVFATFVSGGAIIWLLWRVLA